MTIRSSTLVFIPPDTEVQAFQSAPGAGIVLTVGATAGFAARFQLYGADDDLRDLLVAALEALISVEPTYTD